MNIVLLTERIWGLFFRSARSLSKTAPKSSLGLVSFASMILSWGELQGKRILFRKVGNLGEMGTIQNSPQILSWSGWLYRYDLLFGYRGGYAIMESSWEAATPIKYS